MKKSLSHVRQAFFRGAILWTAFVGAVLSLFGPSGADQREAQDGCQNGQLWLGGPLCYSVTAYASIMTGFSKESR